MDPDATLLEIRVRIEKHNLAGGMSHAEANCLAELIEALDGWISKGGFLPKDWAQAYVKAVRREGNKA